MKASVDDGGIDGGIDNGVNSGGNGDVRMVAMLIW